MEIEDMNLGCFVDANETESTLLKKIETFISGKRDIGSTGNQYLAIDVNYNEEYDKNKKKDLKKGFLFFKFYLDITPQQGAMAEDYMEQLKLLINFLRSQGFKVIPSCDFEDELNNGKPYTELMK